jgi:transcription elongation factor GreB
VGVYITRRGAKALQAELHDLRANKRPKIVAEVAEAAAQGDRSENAEYIYGKKKLREYDRRILFLTKRLESLTVIDPAARAADASHRVFFGATVEVEDEAGARRTYQIVGEDEVDLAAGRVSWRSPLGAALMKKEVGDVATVRSPNGEIELMVVAIRWE